jgi:putative ABC transport system permease protein
LNAIDFDFIDSFGIEMVAGRNIHKHYSTDTKTAMIVNEATVRELGYSAPEEAIGTKLKTGFYGFEGTIIGVTKDHHISSFHEEIEPMAMVYRPEYFSTIATKIQSHEIQKTLTFIEKTWTRTIPEFPFSFSFLNENIDRLYSEEEQTAKIIRTFSIMAIFIACLGLFGLAAYTAERRTKEIGIRKVLGATVPNLIVMLSSEFTKWVLIANILAWPVAYLATNQWLQNFAYRTSIKFWVFVFAAGLAFLISLMTVSYQAIKAAVANPIDSLRYE